MESRAKAGIIGAAMIVAGTVAGAQVTNYETPGNLAVTQNPGCIAIEAAGPELTPPDLHAGALSCVADKRWEAAADLFLLGLVRAAFDTRRVSDETAHQAVPALALQFNKALKPRAVRKLEAAFEGFGGTESEQHVAFCATFAEMAPPSYEPAYMIAHGMDAVMGRKTVRVTPFDPETAWAETLTGYLKCGG